MDNERWRLPAAYLDALGHDDPDFAWEMLRRNDAFRREAEAARSDERPADALASWGLTFRPGSGYARRSGSAGLLAA